MPEDSEINSDLPERDHVNGGENRSGVSDTWEEQTERGEEPFARHKNTEHEKSDEPGSVIFLLHSGQPLSYIANLIRAEGPDMGSKSSVSKQSPSPLGDPPITFHTPVQSKRRWSPATGIGDFLREAARAGNFIINIGSRRVRVNVPTFEERTRFLRAALHEKTRRIERFSRIKDECDRIARRTTQRYAFAGAGIMSAWWLTVGVLTFSLYQ